MSKMKDLIALREGRFWRIVFGLILLYIAWTICHKFVIFPDNFPDSSTTSGIIFCVSWGFVGLALRSFYIAYNLLLQNRIETGNKNGDDNKYKKFIDYLIFRPIFIITGSLIIFSFLMIYLPPNSPIFYTLSIPLSILLGFYTNELLFKVPDFFSR